MIDHADLQWGPALRERRKSLGLRQDELAALAGVSTRFVHAAEAGKATIQLEKLLALLAAMGMRLELVGPHRSVEVRT
jgi:HTH-type transcriptional regulator/antitoxin HipB